MKLRILPVVVGALLMTAEAQSVSTAKPAGVREAPAVGGAGTVSGDSERAETIVIDRGVATFVVATNLPGVTVKGKSEALHARIQIRRASQGVTVDHVEAWLPVRTFATGIALRDQHMRQYVFTTAAGELPDLRFTGGNVSCLGVLAGREAACTFSGTLSMRGVARDFSVVLNIREGGSAPLFRAAGSGLVKLSDYGIEPPSQFGVRTANQIQIHIEFPETAATLGAGP